MGVITTCRLDAGTTFGPVSPGGATIVDLTVLIGHRTCDSRPDVHSVAIDVMRYSHCQKQLAEWIPYVQAARDCHEQNLEVTSSGQPSLYFRVTRNVSPNEELFVWYSDELAERLNLPTVQDEFQKHDGFYYCPNCDERFQFPNCIRAHMRFRCRHQIQQLVPSPSSPQNLVTSSISDCEHKNGGEESDSNSNDCTPPPCASAFDDVTNIELNSTRQLKQSRYDQNGAVTSSRRFAPYAVLTPEVRGLLPSEPRAVDCTVSLSYDPMVASYKSAFASQRRLTSPPYNRINSGSGLMTSSVLSVSPPSPSSAMSSTSPTSTEMQTLASGLGTFVKQQTTTPDNSFQSAALMAASEMRSNRFLPTTIDQSSMSLLISNENQFPFARTANGFVAALNTCNAFKDGLTRASEEGLMKGGSAAVSADQLNTVLAGPSNPLVRHLLQASQSVSTAAAGVKSIHATLPIPVPTPSLKASALPVVPLLPPLNLAQNWCAKCNTGFRMTSDLVHHMRTHHKRDNGVTPSAEVAVKAGVSSKALLRCDICHETFRERHHLTRHMTSHT